MTLEQFAKKAGISLVPCDAKQWGGGIAYQSKDTPNIMTCGFRTERAAYRHWLTNAFGPQLAKAVQTLLKEPKP
jgi:hypothetical protein